MWVSKAIPKVKCFIWRASHQAIPIQIVLEKRDIPIMSRCDGTEDVSHALMLSYWVTRAWFGGMSIRWGSQAEPVWNAWMDSLQKMSETGGEHGEKHRLQGDTLAWEIWKERCQTMHNGENPKLETTIETTSKLSEESWSAVREMYHSVTRSVPSQTAHWRKPTR